MTDDLSKMKGMPVGCPKRLLGDPPMTVDVAKDGDEVLGYCTKSWWEPHEIMGDEVTSKLGSVMAHVLPKFALSDGGVFLITSKGEGWGLPYFDDDIKRSDRMTKAYYERCKGCGKLNKQPNEDRAVIVDRDRVVIYCNEKCLLESNGMLPWGWQFFSYEQLKVIASSL